MLNRREVAGLRVPKIELLQVGETGEGRKVADVCAPEIEYLQRSEPGEG